MFSLIVIFGFALCVGVAIFIPGDLCSVPFGTAHCALLVQLYFHVVHDVCVGFAWFDGRIVFVLVDLYFWRGRATRPVSCLDLPLLLGCAHGKKFVMFIFVCLLCLCAGQASSAETVLVQY